MSAIHRSRARNARFCLLAVNVATVLILSDAQQPGPLTHCRDLCTSHYPSSASMPA